MRFIRAYWGELSAFNGRHLDEILNIKNTSKLDDYVYVWGQSNYDHLTSLGFECEYMGEFVYDYLNNSDIYMLPKLWAIQAGVSRFGEVVFLDWDCLQKREIDSEFYTLLRKGDTIQMPLYNYPVDYKQQVFEEWKDIPVKEKEYIKKQYECLLEFNYQWENSFVTPNAGFIYCNSLEDINTLLELIKKTPNINIAIEEMGFVKYTKQYCKTVLDYVARFEPLVASAKEESHFNQKQLNSILPTKTLYFQHI